MMLDRPILLLYALLLLLVCGCNSKPATGTETVRVASPDGKVDAVLMVRDGGATVGSAYELYIVPNGKIPKENFDVMIADKVKGFSLIWSKNRILNVKFEKARIFSFSNFWHSREVDNFGYMVEVRLKPVSSSSL